MEGPPAAPADLIGGMALPCGSASSPRKKCIFSYFGMIYTTRFGW